MFQLLSDVLTVTGMDEKQEVMAQHSLAPIFYYRITLDAGLQSSHKIIDHVNYNGGIYYLIICLFFFFVK